MFANFLISFSRTKIVMYHSFSENDSADELSNEERDFEDEIEFEISGKILKKKQEKSSL